ncbi:unnamed protein product, partial [Trichogramma brassicae]
MTGSVERSECAERGCARPEIYCPPTQQLLSRESLRLRTGRGPGSHRSQQAFAMRISSGTIMWNVHVRTRSFFGLQSSEWQ